MRIYSGKNTHAGPEVPPVRCLWTDIFVVRNDFTTLDGEG